MKTAVNITIGSVARKPDDGKVRGEVYGEERRRTEGSREIDLKDVLQ